MKRCVSVIGIVLLLCGLTVQAPAAYATAVSENDVTVKVPEESGEVLESIPEENPAEEVRSLEEEPQSIVSENNLNEESLEPVELPEDVISLQVPENLDFFMDPYGLIEGTQIHSQVYSFCNTGESTVRLSLSNIVCELAEDVSSAPKGADEGDVKDSKEKVIRLQICFEDGSIITVTKEPCDYELILESGEQAAFSIGGCMSTMPEKDWENGDAGISLVYDVNIFVK